MGSPKWNAVIIKMLLNAQDLLAVSCHRDMSCRENTSSRDIAVNSFTLCRYLFGWGLKQPYTTMVISERCIVFTVFLFISQLHFFSLFFTLKLLQINFFLIVSSHYLKNKIFLFHVCCHRLTSLYKHYIFIFAYYAAPGVPLHSLSSLSTPCKFTLLVHLRIIIVLFS